MKSLKILTLLTLVLFSVSMVTFYHPGTADARARSGGRSFGSSRSYRPSRSYTPPPIRQPYNSRSSSGSFMRGVGGGLLGGFLGSMLFGGLAHAGGGIGGSGIGLIHLLILGGIGWFIYRRFFARRGFSGMPGGRSGGGYSSGPGTVPPPPPPPRSPGVGGIDAPPPGGGTIYDSSVNGQPAIDEQEIKELAQDIFFKVQAAWMRRDLDAVKDLLGPDLLSQYQAEFQKMRSRGVVNRLENIAVRNVEIIETGRQSGYEYVKIRFTANLLDYTVEESTGKVIEGSDHEPVKFEEIWTLAREEGSNQWKLYAIEE